MISKWWSQNGNPFPNILLFPKGKPPPKGSLPKGKLPLNSLLLLLCWDDLLLWPPEKLSNNGFCIMKSSSLNMLFMFICWWSWCAWLWDCGRLYEFVWVWTCILGACWPFDVWIVCERLTDVDGLCELRVLELLEEEPMFFEEFKNCLDWTRKKSSRCATR